MAAKKKPAALDLLAIAREASTKRREPKTWLDELPPDKREGVIAAAREIESGDWPNKMAIVDAWKANGIPVSPSKLKGLLRRVREGTI